MLKLKNTFLTEKEVKIFSQKKKKKKKKKDLSRILIG